jgi:hypothetical protein
MTPFKALARVEKVIYVIFSLSSLESGSWDRTGSHVYIDVYTSSPGLFTGKKLTVCAGGQHLMGKLIPNAC